MFEKLSKYFTKKTDTKKSDQIVFGIMLAAGILALIASFSLSVEKFDVLQNPGQVLVCDINAAVNCSAVMMTWQASVFGFPNMFIGLMAYAVVITVALAGLSGVKFPRWWNILANIGFAGGLAFAYWLLFQSVYVIEVLCLWCLVVSATTTLIFATMTHYNLKHNMFNLPAKTNAKVQRFLEGGYHQMIVLAWLAFLTALIFLKFGDALFA